MNERQRTGQHNTPVNGPPVEGNEPDQVSNSDSMRELADRLMANTEASLRRLGLSDANAFLNATLQSGGQ